MPGPGCVQCASGEWQCGSDTSELCAAGGGWTPAGSLCLEFFVRKHPQTGNCIIKVVPHLGEECGRSSVEVEVKTTRVEKSAT